MGYCWSRKGETIIIYGVTTIKKIGTLGIHVSAQRNSMVAMKKISFTIISKHLYF